MRGVRLAADALEPTLDPFATPRRRRSSRTRADRPPHPRRARARAALTILALALVAGAAASADLLRSRLAASLPPVRAALASGADGLARLVAPAPRRRAVIFTSVGIGICGIPLAAFLGLRRRRRERELDLVAVQQRARAPQVFEAALLTRPLRRSAATAALDPRATDGLPALGPVPAEVASRAVALRAVSVREAAARAVLLRAASERSESRRRAAGLRARARREERTQPPAAASQAPAAVATSHGAGKGIALEIPAALQIAAVAGPIVAPAAPAPAAAAPAGPPAAPRVAAAPLRPEGGRVALLRASGSLTFEWLERCLARDPEDFQARLDLCTALLVAERFADAERVAREGLVRNDADGRLLLRLSEALAGLGRTEEALEVALRAVRLHRSRKAILHLTRLSALAHRFTPGDGPRLRKALESRPSDPAFLHALGVFESLHGSPRDALTLLRLALRHERTPRWRRIVSREIARLRAEELAGTSGRERRRARG